MIELFVPKKIGNYVIRTQRVLGLEITKSHVYGSLLTYSGTTITLEKTFQESIEQTNESFITRAAETVSTVLSQAPKDIQIYSSLPSSMVTIKELTLPFADAEKILLVLHFELEPYLPFPVSEAVINFIITHKKDSQETTILAAAAQKKYIAGHLEIFKKAGVKLSRLSLDIFDLYGLYRSCAPSHNKTIVLINLDQQVTSLAFLSNTILKNMRAITKGTGFMIRSIAQQENIQMLQALEEVSRSGVEKYCNSPEKLIQQPFASYFQEISLTLQSFLTNTKEQTIDSLVLLGSGSDILAMDKLFQEYLKIPCHLFELHQLMRIPNFHIKNGIRISRAQLVSLGAAYEGPVTQDFNLMQDEFLPSPLARLQKNIITAGLLLIGTLVLVIASSTWIRFSLNKTIRTSEQKVTKTLRELQLTDARDFNKAITEAREKIDKEEDLWFAFSRQRRFSFLETLQKLSLAIDRKSLGLNLKKLGLTSNEVLIEGEVKGFDELKILERELKKSNMFVQIPTLQELKFSERLVLKKNGLESHAGS